MYKTVYHTRGGSMPVYYSETFLSNGNSLQASLRPKGFWRRRLKSWVNYLTGDILDLELSLKSGSDKTTDYQYTWQLQDLIPETKDFRVIAQNEGSFKTNPRGVVNVALGIHHLLQYEAEYHLILTLRHGERKQSETLLNFYAMSRDVFRTNFVNSCMGGFLGAILGLIVGLFINRIN